MMLYLAIELSLFVLAAFVLGWWMGRKSVVVAQEPARAAVVDVNVTNDNHVLDDAGRYAEQR